MLLYEDIITGAEMFSDAFPVKEVDGIVYEVDCAMITIKEGDVDIGANPSAEEQEEGTDSSAQTVNNVIHSFRLQQMNFDLASWKAHIKGYMKNIKEKIPEGGREREEFERGATAYAKKIITLHKKDKDGGSNYEFYIGDGDWIITDENEQDEAKKQKEGMVALLNYREDGITPYFTFWKHGLKQVKL
ncbi:hypothetical protein FS842_004893 [Serendipita sp. 407]|nr:hypothetical protein FS842_004893 [Serendipita sp. 407]